MQGAGKRKIALAGAIGALMAKEVIRRTALCAMGFVLAGCASNITYLPPGKTYGDITVSKPRISTRERLINDRLEEDAWLRAQLRETDNKDFGVQGKTDIRSFSGVLLRAGVNADSKAVELYREQKAQEVEDAKRQGAIKDLDFQIALLKKQKEAADASADPASASSSYYAASPSSAADAAQSGASPPRVDQAITGQLDNLSKGLETLNQRLTALAGRGSDQAPASSGAVSSPIDVFRDRLAYREEIRSELIQNALDDAHDLASNTLYRLSFDTTVVPGADTSAWAVIGVEASLPEDGGLVGPEKFARIVNSAIYQQSSEFAEQLFRECSAAPLPGCVLNLRPDALARLVALALPEKRSASSLFSLSSDRFSPTLQGVAPRPFLTAEEAQRLVSELHNRGARGGAPTRDSIAAGTFSIVQTGLLSELTFNESPDFREVPFGPSKRCRVTDAKRLLGFFVNERNEVVVGHRELAQTTVAREQHGTADGLVVRDLFEPPDGDMRRCGEGYVRLMRPLLDRAALEAAETRLFAYGATPKETVQRISEVLARREASEFALALQAVTGAASADAMLNYIRVNDALFHALRRQPLVVGFSGPLGPLNQASSAAFGWVIGPRYEIRTDGRNQAAGFRHIPVQNSVSGVISVPAAVERVNLIVTKCWKDGVESWGPSATPNRCWENQMVVALPADDSRAFQLARSSVTNARRIELAADSPRFYRVRVGSPASLIIRGDNLWRNTVVLLGGQQADRVSVLPDMRGILATFNKVSSPAQSGSSEKSGLELRVVTSEQSVVAGIVTIEDVGPLPSSMRWSIAGSRFAYPESSLAFKAAPQLPTGYAALQLRLVNRDIRKDPIEIESEIEVSDENQLVMAKLPVSARFAGWQSGNRIELAMTMKRFPKDAAPEVQTLPAVVFTPLKMKPMQCFGSPSRPIRSKRLK